MRVIHLARKPLSEPTVAANVLKHGTGALNIAATRIGTTGRWPANVAFEHLPGCRLTGTVQVPGTGIRGATTVVRETDVRWKPHLNPKSKVPAGRAQPVWGYSDPDGTETVAAWECKPGCPVADLDEISLARGIHGAGHARDVVAGGEYTATSYDMSGPRPMGRFGDRGGASRFFKQVGGQKS